MEKKEGNEKSINEIRGCINKISNKNYDSQRDMIIDNINKIVNDGADEENSDSEDETATVSKKEDIIKITTAIFDIASNNKFYSELYADLYKDISTRFSAFNDITTNFINNYKDSIKEIHYVDANVDYNKHCEYNKENDRRRALSAFIINLMKRQIIEKTEVLDLVSYLQDLILKYIDETNRTNEVDEITENIFIMITLLKTDCVEMALWEKVKANIIQCSKMKSKEKASISSRAVFKYMDMVDFFKKL